MAALDRACNGGRATLLVDGHVHIHQNFESARFLDAAAANFRAAREELGAAGAVFGTLMLTESVGVDRFADLAAGTNPGAGAWRVSPTEEACSLAVSRPDTAAMFLISGRQVAAAERLEVLALGTRERFPDGVPLSETIAAVAASGALPVIPWGFGKWTGRRGRYLAQLFAAPNGDPFYAGDNGGRPGRFPRPRLLGLAERHGRFVLPGTDPLPLPGEVTKPGRFGFIAELDLDPRRPFASLRRWLRAQTASPAAYGRLESLPVFLDRQIGLRARRFGTRQ